MITITNEDNMKLMARYEDNYFDLAIVDPPYGKKPTRDNKGTGGFNGSKNYGNKADIWDVRPDPEYFKELFRVSKNQIIWGANYLIEDLKSSNGFICWDKMNGENIFADFELAYSSFNSRARIYRKQWIGANANNGTTGAKYDHDTVKPETLTRALILTCSRENDLVVVPFAGSGTECAMSAKEKRPFIGYEITEKHAIMSQERANKILKEPTLF